MMLPDWLALPGVISIVLFFAWVLFAKCDGPVERDAEPDDLIERRR